MCGLSNTSNRVNNMKYEELYRCLGPAKVALKQAIARNAAGIGAKCTSCREHFEVAHRASIDALSHLHRIDAQFDIELGVSLVTKTHEESC